jgi:hypothetical protein
VISLRTLERTYSTYEAHPSECLLVKGHREHLSSFQPHARPAHGMRSVHSHPVLDVRQFAEETIASSSINSGGGVKRTLEREEAEWENPSNH